MTRTVRHSSALALSAILLGAGLAMAAPALAAIPGPALPSGVSVLNAGTTVDPAHQVSIDCALLPSDATYAPTQTKVIQLPVPLDGEVTITTQNCASFLLQRENDNLPQVVPHFRFLDGPDAGDTKTLGVDFADTDTLAMTGTQLVVSANAYIQVVESGAADAGVFRVEVEPAVPVANPPGSLLQTFVIEVPATALPSMPVTDELLFIPPVDGRPQLGSGGCGIDTGPHIVATTTVVIERSGTYTFRVSDVSPTVQDIDETQPFRYLGDPFLALYSTFDPDNAQQGLVACDDDSDLDVRTDYYITGSGTMMTDRFPQFRVDLQPGTYTLVLTGYGSATGFSSTAGPVDAASEGNDGSEPEKGGFGSVAFGVDETGTVELWSTSGELAATGPSPVSGGMLAVGLALMTLGGLVFATRRLWSRA
ncbi:MAG: hypothetical protein C0444_10330 [Microbacterium sp.]|nr:hypothetical protein [Microbacterium sp.]MBA4347062.1 hypothetical protein [Microbacterium sp.]